MDGNILKLSNSFREISSEWSILKHLKRCGVFISKFINDAALVQLPRNTNKAEATIVPLDAELDSKQYKYALKLPKLMDVCDYVKSSPDFKEKISIYIDQLVDQLSKIHTAGVIHADIKYDNIMYDQDADYMYLIDFGLSEIVEEDSDGELFMVLDKKDFSDIAICSCHHRPPEAFSPDDLEDYRKWEKQFNALEARQKKAFNQKKYEEYKKIKEKIKTIGEVGELASELADQKEKLYKAMQTKLSLKIEDELVYLEENAPDAEIVFERHGEDVDKVNRAFTKHVTFLCDVYALGVVFMENLYPDNPIYQKLIDHMIDPDPNQRTMICS